MGVEEERNQSHSDGATQEGGRVEEEGEEGREVPEGEEGGREGGVPRATPS